MEKRPRLRLGSDKSGASDGSAAYWNKLVARNQPANSFLLLDLVEEWYRRERIVIRPFKQGQFVSGDLLDDTFHLLAVDQDEMGGSAYSIDNERLHQIMAETLPALNARDGKEPPNQYVLKLSARLTAKRDLPNHKFVLKPVERQAILRHLESLYAELTVRYFDRGDLFLVSMDNTPAP